MDTDERIRVEAVMSTPLETVRRDASVREAARAMRDAGVNALFVPGAEPGIVTGTDVRDAVAGGHDVDEARVGAVMSAPVETVTVDLLVEEAAAMMTSLSVDHLPVVDRDGDVVGMVSTTDVTGALS